MLISNYAIKFRTAVLVMIGVLTLAGARSYMQLPREGTPDITIPYVFVTAPYEGTSPVEMEKLVTVPLEKKINDVENIKELVSTSAENLSFLSIEFLAGQDIEQAKQRVKDKVDLARPDLPTDLDQPVVDAFNFSSDVPVFIFTLSGVSDAARLKSVAEDLQDQLEALSGVKQAEITGTREREIRIEVDLPRLIAHRLPMGQVLGRIMQENRTVSAGNIEVVGDKFQVRLPGEFERAADLREIVVGTHAGAAVRLGDIARTADSFKDLSSVSRVNGEDCVSVSIKKRSGVNAVALIRAVRGILDQYAMPAGIKTTVIMDQSEYVASMLTELENSIASGFILVVLVLMLFMGGRNALFVGVAIPLSMLMAFVLMALKGVTLNMIVLFSLVLAVGMLVDNAIVIVENIFRHHTRGMSREAASRHGTAEVAWPVITSTLTTIVAFAPLLFWPGIMGQFMSFLPQTLIVTLTASLIVALVANPAVCSLLVGLPRRPETDQPHPFVAGYERLLRGALRHRGAVIALTVLFLILSLLVYGRKELGVELFPEVEPRNATISIKFPQGTAIERTDSLLREIEGKLTAFPDIKYFLASAGSLEGMTGSGGGVGTHLGGVRIEFVEAARRSTNSLLLVNAIRDAVGAVPGAEIVVQKEEDGPPTGAPVSIELAGDDFTTLEEYADTIIHRIETVPGLVDLRDDLEQALPELQFRVERRRAALAGLDPDTIGAFLRMSIYGQESGKFRTDEDEYDITLRLPPEQRNDLALFDRIFIPVSGGEPVPLSALGTVVYTAGRGSITRKAQKRVVTISGNDQGRGVDKLIADVRERLADLPLPRGYTVSYTGKNKEMNESGAFLGNAFIVAVGLIMVVLVIQFNSILIPGIIMTTVVLSLVGVMWGLVITESKFSIVMTGLGVISLAGIVVNNGIVLLDCILQRRREGLTVVEAVVNAGKTRLRPVLLTAATTVLGLIPMAAGWGLEVHTWPPRFVAGAESSAWWAPMAVAVVFGLTLATLLTLVVVPVLYSVTDSFSNRLKRWFGLAGKGGAS